MSGSSNTGDATIAGIAAALRDRRAELGITQEALAEAVGLPRPYLSRLENGEATTQVRRLVEVLGAVGLVLVALPRSHPAVREQLARDTHHRRKRPTRDQKLARAVATIADSVELPLAVRQLAATLAGALTERGARSVQPWVSTLVAQLDAVDVNEIDSRRTAESIRELRRARNQLVHIQPGDDE